MHNHQHRANKISIFLSLLCAIHCLITPVIVAIMPFASVFMEKYHWLELVVIFSTLLLGTSSILHGTKYHHHNKIPAYLFFIGIGILSISAILHLGFHIHNNFQLGLNILGALLSAIGQIQNFRLSRNNKQEKSLAY